jgi:hypothetical protein
VEGSRFDDIARSLAGGLASKRERTSRRGVLASLLGVCAGFVGLHTTAAVTCPPGQVYRQRIGCVCLTTGRAPAGGVCPCPRGQVDTGDGQGCLECRSAAECPAFDDPCLEATCDPANGCLPNPVPDGLPGGCATGLACYDGTCAECGTDSDCPTGLACYGGVCAECETDDHCPGFLACHGGRCGCETESDCPADHACVHGGCFKLCQSLSTDPVCTSCQGCKCDYPSGSTDFAYCLDTLTSVGVCDTHDDCPAGTLCSIYISNPSATEMAHLCTRPCCTGT